MTWLHFVFLTVLGLHIVQALCKHIRPATGAKVPATRYWTTALQLVLFFASAALAYQAGAFTRDLVAPEFICLGLLAGHLIFGLSILITHHSIQDVKTHFMDIGSVWKFIVEHPYVLVRYMQVGVSEEIVWRAVAQPLAIAAMVSLIPATTGAIWTGIVLVAVAFAFVHKHLFKNTFLVSLEFLGFSLLLGFLYWWLESLILVILIHVVRDVEIAFLEYLMKVHETGDEERVGRELEMAYSSHLRERHE